MSSDECIERALRSSEPVNRLRSLAENLFAEGYSNAAILESFEKARQELRSADREADEDAVMDVMDILVGWCSPHMKQPRTECGSRPVECSAMSDLTRPPSEDTATTTTHVYRGFVFQIRYRPQDPAFAVEFPDLPEVVSSGTTLPEASAHACEALDLHLESLQKLGLPAPTPRCRVGVEAV
jgi:predicted RNase H-like HicB family nuclease